MCFVGFGKCRVPHTHAIEYYRIIPMLYRVLYGLPVDPALLGLATISLALSFPQCNETGSTIYSFCKLVSLLINVHLRLLHVASSIFFIFYFWDRVSLFSSRWFRTCRERKICLLLSFNVPSLLGKGFNLSLGKIVLYKGQERRLSG